MSRPPEHRSLGASAPGGLVIPEALSAEVRAAYAASGRSYHDNAHLDEVLERFGEVAREVGWERPREVFLALVFHDVVYEPGAKDNEARSAEVAERAISHHLAGEDIDAARVKELVSLTARHGALEEADVDRDAALFCDCDMAILAAPTEAFEAYDRGIMLEYRAVPAELFTAGRRRFFEGLLAKRSIFLSPWGRARFEAAARANLARKLAGEAGG
jgi:predicted metal-dependent HD superfamily phosphohydrolase